MRACVVRSAGCSAVLATALAFAAPPSSASDSFDLRAVVGLPQATLGVGREFAFRNVGIVAGSALLDVEAKVARCVGSVSTPSTYAAAASRCVDPNATDSLGHQFGLVLKVPQWHDSAPW